MSPEVLWTSFGWLGSLVIVLSLSQTKILRLRVLNLVGCTLAMAYNAPLGVWPTVGLNATLALINVIHLIRLSRLRRRAAAAPAPDAAP